MWGSATGDQDSIDRARAAVQWVWTHQLHTGGLPRAFARPEPIEQLDVTSQAVRMALLLGVRTPGVDRAIERQAHDGVWNLPVSPGRSALCGTTRTGRRACCTTAADTLPSSAD